MYLAMNARQGIVADSAQTDSPSAFERRLPVGAEVQPAGGVHFRIWAPAVKSLTIELSPDTGMSSMELHRAESEEGGYHSMFITHAASGMCYRFRTRDGVAPDPVSRFQPLGVHGPAEIIDPSKFRWTDTGWKGVARDGQMIYEMHIGTFTAAGTWASATRELPALAELGVKVLELMPVAEFPGRFGWGYDGVDLFAPTRLYGTPDDFRAFVNRAHELRLGVILDVVYNHMGPDGNYLKRFSRDYFSKRYENEWGEAINFDGENCGGVREFFVANAGYWIDEFHLDGLRLDATQQIFDASPTHVLTEITERVRAAGKARSTYIVAENEPQDVRIVKPIEEGGHGADALWNDDFHHSARVALTGRNEAYYSDYHGTPQEFISAMKWGYLYQGQRYKWQKKRRGTPTFGLHPANFITFLQNHDQIANSLAGQRIAQLSDAARLRAMTTLLLLGPATPMLFQGQEFAASSPFLYFADHQPELAKLVTEGRAKFLQQFPSIGQPEVAKLLASPSDEQTFQRCKLDLHKRETHREIYALHRDLLALRHGDPVFSKPRPGRVDGAVLSPEAFVLRYFAADGDRLLIVNLGRDLHLDPAPEPLLAPVSDCEWALAFSSEDPRYGGGSAPTVESEDNWRIPARAALVLAAKQCTPHHDDSPGS